ncbi:hypothetical protein [Streptomyces gobiensis]|uniref:hypothetical protein n=1 Tax=Streptomyces gobiensis TaxID=2875706 RepID=UPI001E41A3C1|nr:hypothetical protein [Streptomyces gobiensis]UGY93374.1 hypothetical protein test1122_17745 [Streptomyces gobiensis]
MLGVRDWGRDRGATGMEYLGIIMVVALVIVGISATSVGQSVNEKIYCAISQLTGGDCSTGDAAKPDEKKTDEDYRPLSCQTASRTESVSNEAKILWIKVGDKHDFKLEEFNVEDENGKVDKKFHMTFVSGSKAGLEFKPTFGGKVNTGDRESGGASVSIGGGLEISDGSTWVFDSEEEAMRFKDDLERLHQAEESTWTKPGWRVVRDGWREHVSGSNKDLRKKLEKEMDLKQVKFRTVGLDAGAEANLAGPAMDDEIAAQIGGKVQVSGSITETENWVDNTHTATYAFALEGEMKAELEAGGAKAGAFAGQRRNGAIGVTRDMNSGELRKITITRTVDTKAGASAGVSDGEASGTGKGTAKDTEVITTTLKIPEGPDGNAMRKTAEDWLNGPAEATEPIKTAFASPAPDERPADDDAFGQLLFDHGKTSKGTYASVEDAASFGFELNVMAGLGYNRTITETSARIMSGDYLAAPRGDTRTYRSNELCSK